MKKFLTTLLALCMVLSLVACASTASKASAEAAEESTAEVPTEAPAEEAEAPAEEETEAPAEEETEAPASGKMSKLWSDITSNLSFVLICAAIIAAIGIAARLLEKRLPQLRKVSPARRVSIVGICAALATVLHILDFPLVFLAPSFYKLDFSEVPVLLAGFYLGPSATVACEGVKILLKLLVKGTSTAFVGDFANFVVGCFLVLPATVIYHLKKTRRSAILGLAVGTVCMAIFGSAFNAVYLLPKFAELYGMPLDTIIAMGTQIFSSVNNVTTFVFYCVAPLNVVKGAMVSVLTMLLYKHVAAPLFRIKS